MDSIPIVCHHRAGADASDRQRRLPGVRHGRHHPAVHQAQLSGEGHRRPAARAARGVPRRPSGRPGPVVIDIPKDIQFAKGTYIKPERRSRTRATSRRLKGDRADQAGGRADGARQAAAVLHRRRRHQFRPEAPSALLRELVKLTGFPITSTLMGLGAYPASDPQWLGMLGMHGTWEANWAMHDCDLMICIGARFDDRITGRLDAFSPGSKKIHIDIDPSSINKNVHVDVPIVGDCAHVLEDMLRVGAPRRAARQEGAGATGGSRSTMAGAKSLALQAVRRRSSSRNTRSSGSTS